MEPQPLSANLVGTKFEPRQVSWNSKDTMLYALGVGARPSDELDFLYEGRGPNSRMRTARSSAPTPPSSTSGAAASVASRGRPPGTRTVRPIASPTSSSSTRRGKTRARSID